MGQETNATQALAVLRLNGNQVSAAWCELSGAADPVLRTPRAGPATQLLAARPHLPVPPAPAHAQLTGTLPVEWAAPDSFSALRSLTLDGNRLSGGLPDAWRALPAITDLNLSGSGLGGQLPAWGPDPATLQSM